MVGMGVGAGAGAGEAQAPISNTRTNRADRTEKRFMGSSFLSGFKNVSDVKQL
jgi:hypothetical protein